jgi:hypothetical protein
MTLTPFTTKLKILGPTRNIYPPSFMKFCPVVPEICRGHVHVAKEERRIIIITRIALQSNSGRHPTPLFWYLGFHGNVILNFINTPKASTHYSEYSYDVS